MLLLPAIAALAASAGWAVGIVLAQAPARALGAFAFTRIQLVACAALMALACSVLGLWPSIDWSHWPAYIASVIIGIVLGNLAMIECLRLGGPRRTELLLTLKAPLVAAMAFVWLGEVPGLVDLFGAGVVLAGVCLAIQASTDATEGSDALNAPLAVVVGLGLAATACQGFGFLVMKPAMVAGTEPLAASALRLLGAALVISVVALWPARAFEPKTAPTPGLIAHTILPGFIGYGISSSLLLYAFANFNAGLAAVLGSLSPVLVLPLVWAKDRRRLSAGAVFGAILAVAGAGLIVLV